MVSRSPNSIPHTVARQLSIGVAALLLIGCHSLQPLSEVAFKPKDADASTEPEKVKAVSQSPDTDGDSGISGGLNSGRWWLAPPAGPGEIQRYRWRHDGVEQAVKAADKEALRTELKSSKPAARVNAAIALARLDDGAGAAALAGAAADSKLETNQRCAAVESLGAVIAAPRSGPASGKEQATRVEGAQTQDAAAELAKAEEALLALLKELSAEPSPPGYQPALHAELLLAVSATKSTIGETVLAPALSSSSPEVRGAALACYASRDAALPPAASDLRTDPDPRVRIAALRAIASLRDASAAEMLGEALRDADFHVRLAAIHALGSVGNDPARDLLREELKDRGELVRAAAVTALAKARDWPPVISAGGDASWRVRRAVAQTLAMCEARTAKVVAERLLHDPSPDVEAAVVTSVAVWPVEDAGPILLSACDHVALSTRQQARDALVHIWPAAKSFSASAPLARRVEMLAGLRTEFDSQFGTTADEPPGPLEVQHPAQATLDESVEEIRELVVALAGEKSPDNVRRKLAALERYGDRLLPALDQLTSREELLLREEIYSETLAKLDLTFAALAQMRSGNTNERRSASGRLANRGAEGPLSRLAIARLGDQMTKERDPVVWLNVWRIVENQTGEPVFQLAYLALEDSAPETRRQACEYLGRHPAPRHAIGLMRSLRDSSPNVARAAAMALGHCGPLDDLSRLRQAAESRDPRLRFAAALSLARLGDVAGRTALERFSYEGDSDLRRDTAEAMGELKDKRFVPALIRLLDDRDNVRRSALQALNTIVGANKVPSGSAALSYDEQARRWQAWWQQSGGAASLR